MKRRDLSIKKDVEVKEVFFIKPYFYKKKKSEAHEAGFVGVPGNLDEEGVLIPRKYFLKNRFPHGTIVTPPRRSLYSGLRYATRRGMKTGDSHFRRLCSDPVLYAKMCEWGRQQHTMSDKRKIGLQKYFAHLSATTSRKNASKNTGTIYKEGYLRVGGVVKIKKVLKPKRKDFFAVEEPTTGVQILENSGNNNGTTI